MEPTGDGPLLSGTIKSGSTISTLLTDALTTHLSIAKSFDHYAEKFLEESLAKEAYDHSPFSVIPFSVDKFKTGKYIAMTKRGDPVVINVNGELHPHTYCIDGHIQGVLTGLSGDKNESWTKDGSFFKETAIQTIMDGTCTDPAMKEVYAEYGTSLDLVLVPKPMFKDPDPVEAPVTPKPVEYEPTDELLPKFYVYRIKERTVGSVLKQECFMESSAKRLEDAIAYVKRHPEKELHIINSNDIPGIRETLIAKGLLVPKS